MPENFDARLVRAKWELDELPSEKMPALAADALEAGFDGPTLRKVAGLTNISRRDLLPYADKLWMELDVPILSKKEALHEIIKERARRMVADPDRALEMSKDFWRLYYDHDFEQSFWPFLEPEEYRPIYYTDEQAKQQLVAVSNAVLAGSPIPPGRSDIARQQRARQSQLRSELRRCWYRTKVFIRRLLN